MWSKLDHKIIILKAIVIVNKSLQLQNRSCSI